MSDNPFLAFTGPYEPFRKTFNRWDTIVGQVGYLHPPQSVPLETVNHWLPPVLRDDRYTPGMRKYLANSGAGVNEEETCAARVYSKAMDVLDELSVREPWCFVVDCFDPHEPWSPAKKYIDMYGDPTYRGPEIGVTRYGSSNYLTEEQIRRLHAVYAAEVTQTDHWLGRFLDKFYERGLDENTVIVMLSDHGYLLGERGLTGKVPSQLHPELAQVPFIVIHPDDKAAGRSARTSPRPTTWAPPSSRWSAWTSRAGWRDSTSPPSWTASSPPIPVPSTTAGCTTASSSAPTSGC